MYKGGFSKVRRSKRPIPKFSFSAFLEVGRGHGIVVGSGWPLASAGTPTLHSKRGSPTASRPMVRLAAVISIFLGLGFVLPCAYGIRYLSTTGEVWTFLGLPTYGGGPFEGIGIRTTVSLLVAFRYQGFSARLRALRVQGATPK